MKKLFFISFFTIVIISAAICIAVGFQSVAITTLVVGFFIGLAIALGILHSHYIDGAKTEDYNLGELIGIGIGIGTILAIMGAFLFHFWIGGKGVMLLFLGPILGNLSGYMYPFKDKSLKAET